MDDLAAQHNALFSLYHRTAGFKNEGEYQRSRNRMERIAECNHSMVSYYNLYTRRYQYLHSEYDSLLYHENCESSETKGYDNFYGRVHPDDLANLYYAEMEAFKLINANPSECQSNFILITTPRVRNHFGGYCRLLRRISCLMQGSGGKPWLLTIIADMLEEHAEENAGLPKLYNTEIGRVYQIETGKYWSDYSLPFNELYLSMLYFFGHGFTIREVADKLFLSAETIATYRSKLLSLYKTSDIQVVYKMVSALGYYKNYRPVINRLKD